MTRIDKNRVQQLEKELKGLVVPNHQYKKWELKEDLTKEQLISLENLLVKESRKTRREEHKWSKEIKHVLNSLYPGLHACCFLRSVREKMLEENENTWQGKIKKATRLTKLAEKEVREAEQLRIKEATNLLFNNPQEFFKHDRKQPKQ